MSSPELKIGDDKVVILTLEAWKELTAVLREFVCRADAGQEARDCYERMIMAVKDANRL